MVSWKKKKKKKEKPSFQSFREVEPSFLRFIAIRVSVIWFTSSDKRSNLKTVLLEVEWRNIRFDAYDSDCHFWISSRDPPLSHRIFNTLNNSPRSFSICTIRMLFNRLYVLKIICGTDNNETTTIRNLFYSGKWVNMRVIHQNVSLLFILHYREI